MQELLNYVRKRSGEDDIKYLELLPIIVSFDGMEAEKIAAELNMNGQRTETRKPINTYYGKHATDIGEGIREIELDYVLYCPIVFVYDICEKDIKNIYPFNIEEYQKSRWVNSKIDINSFDLGNEVEDILRYIHCFYGTNKNYWNNLFKEDTGKSSQENILREISKKSGSMALKTVNITMENLEIINESLKCIIMPELLTVYEEFSTLLTRTDIEVKTYKTNSSYYVGWHNIEVNRLLEEYLVERGKL